MNRVVSSFRLRRFVTARVATDFQGTNERLAMMVSWRKFIGSKRAIGSSNIVACSVVVLLPYPFNESYQPLELAKVIIELFGKLLQN